MADKQPKADDRLTTALERFKFCAEAERKQRNREVEAVQFAAGEQWTDAARQMRQGQPNGQMPAIGARPCLTINLIAQPLQQVINQFNDADLGIHVAPTDDAASEETADLLDEFYTELQTESRANVARGWAFKQAAMAGRGYYRILTRYADDRSKDQKICIDRILNQQSVYLDPFHVQPDASDIQWGFITEDMPFERFKTLYGESKLASATDSDLTSWANKVPGWVTNNETGKVIRVAEYWYLEETKGEIASEDDDTPASDVRDDLTARTVKWLKITAADILEEQEWAGSWIPIVMIPGREWHWGAERRWDGLVADSMDANRSYNAMRSAQVEAIAFSPKPRFFVATGQIEGYEDWWKNMNTINFPFIPYHYMDAKGNPVGEPKLVQSTADIQAITIGAQQAQADVRATSGIPEVALGNADSTNQSGKAILKLQRQMEQGTGHYLENLKEIALPHEARIVLDLIPKIYDRAGRKVHVRAKDGTRRQVVLNQPYQDPKTQESYHYDLTAGTYHATATISKSFTSRREMTAEALAELIQADPTLMQVFGDVYLDNEDFPQHAALSQRMQAVLDPRVQAVVTSNGDVPPQLQGQMAQMKGAIQQLQAQLGQAQQVIQTKQVESQAKLQEAQMDNDTKIKVAFIQATAQVGIAQEKIDAENARTYLEAWEQRANKVLDLHMARLKTVMDGMQQNRTQAVDHAHEAGLAAMEHQHATDQADQVAAHGLAQMAMQPQPQQGATE